MRGRRELILSMADVVLMFSALVQAAALRVVVECSLPVSANATNAKPPA
jgi:hypothetical protein